MARKCFILAACRDVSDAAQALRELTPWVEVRLTKPIMMYGKYRAYRRTKTWRLLSITAIVAWRQKDDASRKSGILHASNAAKADIAWLSDNQSIRALLQMLRLPVDNELHDLLDSLK